MSNTQSTDIMIKELQTVLNSEIPLTNAIGILVSQYTGDSITLSAPLENNINHKNTAFGGSLYSVSVLTGWSLVYALLKENNLSGHIVIQESNTRFLLPVDGTINAHCRIDSTEKKHRFLRMYRKKGIARIELTVITHIKTQNTQKDAVIFTGTYVVHT